RDGAGEIRVLEPDALRPRLHLARVQQRRQPLWDVVEDPFAPLVLALQLLPALAHPLRRLRLRIAEHVRMARDELRVDRPCRSLEVAGASLLQQQGEEVRLEEEIADLVEELRVVTRERRIGNLVRLLDRMRDDRPLRLLAVP